MNCMSTRSYGGSMFTYSNKLSISSSNYSGYKQLVGHRCFRLQVCYYNALIYWFGFSYLSSLDSLNLRYLSVQHVALIDQPFVCAQEFLKLFSIFHLSDF